MSLGEIIKAIQESTETEQSRLKEFFSQSLSSFSANELVFKDSGASAKNKSVFL